MFKLYTRRSSGKLFLGTVSGKQFLGNCVAAKLRSFPPALAKADVRYYLAVAMIMWYQTNLRDKHGWPRFHVTCTQSDWRSGPKLDLSRSTRFNPSG